MINIILNYTILYYIISYYINMLAISLKSMVVYIISCNDFNDPWLRTFGAFLSEKFPEASPHRPQLFVVTGHWRHQLMGDGSFDLKKTCELENHHPFTSWVARLGFEPSRRKFSDRLSCLKYMAYVLRAARLSPQTSYGWSNHSNPALHGACHGPSSSIFATIVVLLRQDYPSLTSFYKGVFLE